MLEYCSKFLVICFDIFIFWQNATALFIGSGSESFKIPSLSRICFDNPFIQPMNLEASFVFNSLSPLAIMFCISFGISLSFRVNTRTL